MARNKTWMPAPPEAVFEVLADPYTYAEWVVGARRIRDADPGWPGLGTRLYHEVGKFPLISRDHTRVTAVDPPHRLELEAVARPFGAAKICIEMRQQDGGTLVTFVEDPAAWTTPLKYLPPMHLLTRVRNGEALRRLERIVVRRGKTARPGQQPELASR